MQLSLKFSDLPVDSGELNALQRRQKIQKENKAAEIDQLFDDWAAWYKRTRQIVADPNPFVQIKAVFIG